MDEQDRWLNPLDAERDAEVEHLAARELARRERLDEKGLPHNPLMLYHRNGIPYMHVLDYYASRMKGQT